MGYTNWENFLLANGNKCAVYGAGVVARIFAEATQSCEEEFSIDCFLLSYDSTMKECYFRPVLSLDRIQHALHTPIVIATRGNVRDEIKENLEKQGFFNIYTLSDEECTELRKSISPTLLEMIELGQEIRTEIERIRVNEGEFRSNFFEKKMILDDFIVAIQNEEVWEEKVKRLVSGLDSKSAEVIYQIIDRLFKLVNNERIHFTNDEIKVSQETVQNYHKQIYKIGKDHFVYGNYHLPSNRFGSSVFLDEHGLFDLDHPEYLFGKDILDAGAFIGDSSLVLGKYTSKKVHAFEASEHSVDQMKQTIALNQMEDRIIPIYSALSDVIGTIDLYVDEENPVATSVVTSEDLEKISVPCTTIDAYVTQHNLKIGLIKTDVEGAEQGLLRGAIETIRTQKPTLSISIYHNLEDFLEIKPWVESLGLGYRFKVSRSIYHSSFICDTVLICEI